MSETSEDCLGCRLISGFGIIGIGAYIYYQARHRRTLEKYTMNAISAGKNWNKVSRTCAYILKTLPPFITDR